jgi:hypothetical protein
MAIRFHKWISQVGLAVCVCACYLFTDAIEAQNSHPQTNGNRHQGCPLTKAADAFVPPSPYKNTTRCWQLLFRNAKTMDAGSSELVDWSEVGLVQSGQRPEHWYTARCTCPAQDYRPCELGIYQRQAPFVTTGISSPPNTGCWEITGRLAGEEVKYVVWLSTSSELQGGG